MSNFWGPSQYSATHRGVIPKERLRIREPTGFMNLRETAAEDCHAALAISLSISSELQKWIAFALTSPREFHFRVLSKEEDENQIGRWICEASSPPEPLN